MSSTLILLPLQGFSSRETNFHFYQFLSNFLRYFFLNFLLFHLYNIFAVYFLGSSPLLNFFSSAKSNFSYCLTSALNFSLNFSTASFAFSKSFSFSYVSCLLWYAWILTFFFFFYLFFLDFIFLFVWFSFLILFWTIKRHMTIVTWHITWCEVIGLNWARKG